MATLALEITASRLLGAIFGTSNLVWASIIGLILIYLTAGYFIGGKWADRSPNGHTMYRILAWGGFAAGLVPLIAKPVLPIAAAAFDSLSFGVLAGSFVGVLILFAAPITLLGTMSPFAIRLAITDSRSAGTISGRIYAVSTLGSFVGTFLPVLFLIPLAGTPETFLVFSLLLVITALGGLWLHAGRQAALKFAWMPILLLLSSLLWTSSPFKRSQGQIYEAESAYNYIEVLETEDDYVLLRLNEGQGIHSVYHPEIDYYFGPWMQFLAAPFFYPNTATADVQRIAIVGLAAGTTARQASLAFGPVPIDGYEIDPHIIQVGIDYFQMDMANLNAISADGRVGLNSTTATYTYIAVDAYKPPYIPWHLTTQEFFQIVFDHLDPNGTLAINVARAHEDTQMLDGLVGTIGSVFPSVYVMDIPGTFNSIIYATRQPTRIADFGANLDALEALEPENRILLEAMRRVVDHQRPTPISDVVFTDDWAPIEWITNNMVLNYIAGGGVENLE
jgi:spermidine synthase